MTYSKERLNNANARAVRKERQSWFDRLFCKHDYEQTHPEPLPLDDWPKGRPAPPHGDLVNEGTGRSVAQFICSKCGKKKSIRIEALSYLTPHKPPPPPKIMVD